MYVWHVRPALVLRVGVCVCVICACSSVILHLHMFALRASSRLIDCLFVCVRAHSYIHICAQHACMCIFTCACTCGALMPDASFQRACMRVENVYVLQKCIHTYTYTYIHDNVHTISVLMCKARCSAKGMCSICHILKTKYRPIRMCFSCVH